MRAFGELYERLDSTTSSNAKVAALADYFSAAQPGDAAWAVWFLSGRRLKRTVGRAALREWLLQVSGLPDWLVEETHAEVGDLAETIALLVDGNVGAAVDVPLQEWIERLLSLPAMAPERQRECITGWWRELDARGRFLLNKLLTGELRVGVSSGMVEKALAEVTQLPRSLIAHRLMANWAPDAAFWNSLRAAAEAGHDLSRPYPFCLASPLENDVATLGNRADWLIEWKWDGIRAQVLRRRDGVHIWSRGEELITERFPEIVASAQRLPLDTVVDGEILAWGEGGVRPFGELQTRIGRRKLSPKILEQTPVRLLAYDLLEVGGEDVRSQPLWRRREQLDQLLAQCCADIAVSPLVGAEDWPSASTLRGESRMRLVEGMMLKRADSAYGTGRQRGTWWKWKVEPYSFDGVLVYAQPGRGRRANLLTDYTFAVRDGEKLVPVAKAYSGLTDSEIGRVDKWIRQNTVERFGPVRSVRPQMVFEIAFEGINESGRHKSGVAVRFPRIARWREDKPASEVDSLDDLRRLLRAS